VTLKGEGPGQGRKVDPLAMSDVIQQELSHVGRVGKDGERCHCGVPLDLALALRYASLAMCADLA